MSKKKNANRPKRNSKKRRAQGLVKPVKAAPPKPRPAPHVARGMGRPDVVFDAPREWSIGACGLVNVHFDRKSIKSSVSVLGRSISRGEDGKLRWFRAVVPAGDPLYNLFIHGMYERGIDALGPWPRSANEDATFAFSLAPHERPMFESLTGKQIGVDHNPSHIDNETNASTEVVEIDFGAIRSFKIQGASGNLYKVVLGEDGEAAA